MLLPLPLLQEHVDSSIRYEEKTKSVILSTESELLYMQEDKTDASLNNRPLQLRLAPEVKEKITYLPADVLEDLYGFEIQEDTTTGAVLLMTAGETVPLGKVKGEAGDKTVALRSEASIHAPIVADMSPGAIVSIWNKENEDWLYVQLSSGYAGYTKASDIISDGQKTVEPKAPLPHGQNEAGKGSQ